MYKCDVCITTHASLSVYVRIPNVKEGFAKEERTRECVRVCVVCVRTCMCVYARRMGVPVEKGVGIVSVKRKKIYTHTHTT